MIIPSLPALFSLPKNIFPGFRVQFLADFTPFIALVTCIVFSFGNDRIDKLIVCLSALLDNREKKGVFLDTPRNLL